jgi:1-acyl-sn-glycerol-3-phosphate acyltransferase
VLYRILKPIAVALMRAGFHLDVRGREHVPGTGPALLVSNHVSLLDPPFVGAAAPRELFFLAKEELFRVPLFGRFIHALNARPVRRDGADGRALKTALKLLGENRAILLFPEGTRGVEGRLGEGKPGAGMLAVLSGAPVVPVCVSGTARALPPGRALPRLARVSVTFGPPLVFKAAGDERRKERYREATEEMMRAIAQLMAREN